MTLSSLILTIDTVHQTFHTKAMQSVSINLTLRNFIIGYYIVEYEQNGSDRATYGSKLIENMAQKLSHIKGMSSTALKLMRQFYLTYPQISQSVTDQFKIDSKISQSMIDQSLYVPTEKLLRVYSFTHFIELVKIDDELKRTFYEVETIKGNWSVRELKRQVELLLYERVGLSTDKKSLLQSLENKKEVFDPISIIKEPYILDFTGLETKEKYNEHDRIDLVFYHRVLKCHILVDLKVRAFSHADVGQMNFYLNYYKNEISMESDNPPIGIILCTEKNNIKVEYATAGLDENPFVSKYKIVLPSIKELEELVKEDLEDLI
ncbi:PDDEXK nuclease domain-containing protein [Arcobacter cloacae]|uniref:Cytoplasmic protein n=1 Tax=Arcobacter cloacae TaxID=1054034 RepID=A0A4Q0ZH51_9BACT|nr:PDDEXK nuclease domain-containing protein [Arcobacter cloacae]RXJ82888.1 cytoplasmic protein [Arcobacter cloacae]